MTKNLKAAGDEIEAIIKKYDVAGFCTLWEPDYRELRTIIDPSFSCVKIGKDRVMRVVQPIVDPMNQEPAKKIISNTVNMLTHLGKSAYEVATMFGKAVFMVREQFGLMPKINGEFKTNGN